jgi:peptidoglycan-associated lipoprotein
MKQSWRLGTISTIGLLLSVVLLLSGCPKQADLGGMEAGSTAPTTQSERGAQSEETVKPSGSIQEPRAIGAPSAQQPTMAGKESPLKDVFFDYDKSTIRDDVKSNLNEDLQWLNTNPTAQIIIEGHCDERGTSEYNLALGERRARAARDYLVAAGIDAGRIKIVSFGKERPFAMGHDEAAWKWNRRAHFVVDER